jgi:signal transduction histidine kinase
VRLGDLPAERLAAPVETAAYVLVDEVLARAERRAGPAIVDVAATVVGGVLEVAVHDRGERSAERAREELLGVGDRVGALDGTLEVEPGAEGVVIRAELPCA